MDWELREGRWLGGQMKGGGRWREGRGEGRREGGDVQAKGGDIVEVLYRDPDCGFGHLS